jgi:ATP-dependent protease ClpP protease subunit
MENKLISSILLFVLCVGLGFSLLDEPVQATIDPSAIMLTPQNHVLIKGEISMGTMLEAQVEMMELIEKRGNHPYPLYVVLDTPGGDVIAGMRFYELIKPYKNIHTITLNAFSMGAIFVEFIEGSRLVTETSTIMFHRMALAMPNTSIGQQISRLNYYAQMEQEIYIKLADRIGIDVNELYAKLDAEWYLSAREALKSNVADKVVSVRCSKELLKKFVVRELPVLPGFPPIEIKVSACPLMI